MATGKRRGTPKMKSSRGRKPKGGLRFKNDTAAIWLSGDGSYEVFRKPGSLWIAPPGETARLVGLGSPQNGGQYILYLDTGASLGFRSDGWQVWTQDLAGNYTRYGYETANPTQLDSIIDPTGKQFHLSYFTSGKRKGNVKSIQLLLGGAPDTVVTLEYDSVSNPNAARLARVRVVRGTGAGQSDSTRFTYTGGAAYGAYIDSIIDPRDTPSKRVVSRLTYDPALWTPKSLNRPLNGIAQTRLVWRRAAPRNAYGRAGNPQERTIAINQYVGTSMPFAGSPTDYTVDAFGGPTMVRVGSWPST